MNFLTIRDALEGFGDRSQAQHRPFIGLAEHEPVRSFMWTRCITMMMAPVRLRPDAKQRY